MPDLEGISPTHCIGKRLISSKGETKVCYYKDCISESSYKTVMIKKKSNVSVAITHKCANSLPRKLIQRCTSVKKKVSSISPGKNTFYLVTSR